MGGLISGKFLFLLVVALLVLGPEKLPEAARAAGRLLHEFRRMTGGLQDEVREAFQASDLAAPVQELRAVRDGFREAATGLVSAPFSATPVSVSPAAPGAPAGGAGPTGGPGSAAIEPVTGTLTPVGAGSVPAWAGVDREVPRVPAEMGLPPGDPSLN